MNPLGLVYSRYAKKTGKMTLKALIAKLPRRWQTGLKCRLYARQIRRGTFRTTEPEYALLPDLVSAGDWVVDIGANVGHYTCRLSELVGPAGRVLAFEPVPTTMALLAANTLLFAHPNVSLFNVAVSDQMETVALTIPQFHSGLDNYYEAQIGAAGSGLPVVTLPLDSLPIPHRVAVVKIDVEGHEARVLKGMEQRIRRDHPVLIVETGRESVVQRVEAWGYSAERLPTSPNVLFRPISKVGVPDELGLR